MTDNVHGGLRSLAAKGALFGKGREAAAAAISPARARVTAIGAAALGLKTPPKVDILLPNWNRNRLQRPSAVP